MDAPSIKLILPPIKSIGITTCALGKFLHTQKKKRRRRRPSFIHHIHKIKIKNWDLHIFPHSVLITLVRVLLCLCIAASVRPSQGYYVPLHWCIRVNLMRVSCVLVDHIVLKRRSVATSTLFEELALDLHELIPIQPPCIWPPFFRYPSSLDK
jgi:hypothetical protein